MSRLEAGIYELTRPLNGQSPRPWMTKLADPSAARVFIVGRNQAKGFPVERVGSRQDYMDALFNRNGKSIRELYDEITGLKPSRTRRNIDYLTCRLEQAGVPEILETNVICYSTPMGRDLAHSSHQGGRERGRHIFRTLLHVIRPPTLIAHGKGTIRDLESVLGVHLPKLPTDGAKVIRTQADGMSVYVLPSLAPPAFKMWSKWAENYMDKVASAVAADLAI